MNQVISIFFLCTLALWASGQDVTGDVTNASSGGTDGAIDLHVNGGFSPYVYEWSSPDHPGFNSTDQDISDLAPGEYCVTVVDIMCGQADVCFEVEADCPPLILGIAHHGFIECEGGTGMLTVVLSGEGEPPFEIEWSNGETTETIEDLPEGYYSVTVTDANDCESSHGLYLYPIHSIDVELGNEEHICDGEPGNLSVLSWNGATGDVSFAWTKDGQAYAGDQASISPTEGGLYCVTVMDEIGCTKEACSTIYDFDDMVVIDDINQMSDCFQGEESNDGSISITINTPPGVVVTDLQWTGPNGFSSTEEDISDLGYGTYTLTVRLEIPGTEHACEVTETVRIDCCELSYIDDLPNGQWGVVTEELVTEIELEDITPASSGNCDGAIDISIDSYYESNVGGGFNANPTYVISWTGPNGFTSDQEDISGLCPGTYCVTVDDGCDGDQACFEVIDCSTQNITISGSTQNTCDGYNVGSAQASATGGTSPYSFEWSNGGSGASISGLGSGTYTVTVEDANGCSNTRSFTVGSDPTQVIRDGCVFTEYCRGNPVNSVNIGSYSVYRSSDCRYIDYYCTDGYYLGEQFVGTYFDHNNSPNCVVYEYCYNGQLWDTHFGQYDAGYVAGYDQGADCWYCDWVELCDFGPLGYYIVSVTSHLGISNVANGGCGEGNCYTRIYCGETIIAEGCSDCNEQGCFRGSPVQGTEIIDGEEVVITRFPDAVTDHQLLDRLLKENDMVGIDQPLLSEEPADSEPDLESDTRSIAEATNALSLQAMPNPFENVLYVTFALEASDHLDLRVYNALGRKVFDRGERPFEKGDHRVDLDLATLPSGIYFVEAASSTHKAVVKIIKSD